MDMSLLKYLSLDTVTPDLKGTNKQEIIEELLDIICRTGKVKDRKAALDAILARENKMSTGMENGIAIPHGKTDAVEELLACVGISKQPVDFNSLDGKPCRIFIMTVSPSHRTGPHIQFLSEISSLLRSESKRNRLLEAKDAKTILQVLSERP
ncbi:MAG: PTS sugar transporter subunit IIA [Spirochaetales bacterium]